MNSGFSKNIEGTLTARRTWRMLLLCLVICLLGVLVASRYADDIIRKIVGDRASIDHARILTEADLVPKLEELLGTLVLHQKLVMLKEQIAEEASGASQAQMDAEESSQEILHLLSARRTRQYHVFRSTVEQLPESTDLFAHFLPEYDNIQARLVSDLKSVEVPLLAIASKDSQHELTQQHDLIRDTLSRYQLIMLQVSSRASLSLGRTISIGSDQLLLFLRTVIIGIAVLLSGAIVLLVQWRDRARIRESAVEAYESLIGVMEFMDPSWAINTSGTVIHWNRAIEKLTGIASADILGKDNYEYAIPFYGERRKMLIDLVLDWDDEITKKYLFIDTLENGAIFAPSYHPDLNAGTYIASSAQQLKTASGEIIGAIETVRDITQETHSKEELFKLKGEGQKALRLAEERLSALHRVREVAADVMITYDRENLIRSVNRAAESVFGYTPDELVGRSILSIIGVEDSDALQQDQRVEREGRHRDGTTIPVGISVSEITEDGVPVFVASVQNLKGIRDTEAQVSHLESLLSLKSLDFINQGISVFDRDLKLLSANQAFLELQNFPPDFGKPGTPMEVMFRFNAERGEYGEGDADTLVEDRLALARKFEPHEFERTRNDGVIISIAGTPIDEGIGGFITVYTDVTEEREREKHLILTDQVTGLPNQKYVEQLSLKAIQDAEQSGKELYGVRIKIDRFQVVDQLYGTEAGNALIKEVALRLKEAIPGNIVLGRGAGNEFLLIELCSGDARDASEATIRLLQEIMKYPFHVKSHGAAETEELMFSMSGGIVLYPKDGNDLATLTKKSQLALQYASEQSDTYHYFDWQSARRKGSGATLKLENELRVALQRSQFELHYQPQIDLGSGRLTGAEALIRWSRPDSGGDSEVRPVSPAEFIPVAEESGLIIPIGKWVLEEACRQARRWQDAGHPPLTMSVNVSAVQFRQPDLIEQVREVLSRTGLDPEWLELEITESIVVEDIDRIVKTLDELKALGIRIAIDDFGTGYSSLSYLARLPFDKLKIDQSFVRNRDRQNWAIVRAVVQLARSLELKIVAEGVETKESMQHLRDLGCHIGQGFYFSKPLLPSEFTECFDPRSSDGTDHSSGLTKTIRVGLPTDFGLLYLNDQMTGFRKEKPDVPVSVRCDLSNLLVESLVLDELDSAVAIVREGAESWLLDTWEIDPVWVASTDFELNDQDTVPLVVHPEGCEYRRRIVESLNAAGRDWYVAYQSPDIAGLQNAVLQGLGISVLTQPTLVPGMKVFEAGKTLPQLRSIKIGLYRRRYVDGENVRLIENWLREALVRQADPEAKTGTAAVSDEAKA